MPRVDKDTVIQEILSALPTKPIPDSAEWWQEVAQGLGGTIGIQRQRIETLEQALRRLLGASEHHAREDCGCAQCEAIIAARVALRDSHVP